MEQMFYLIAKTLVLYIRAYIKKNNNLLLCGVYFSIVGNLIL